MKRDKPIRLCVITSFPPVKGGEATYAQDFVFAMERYFYNDIHEIYVLSHTEHRQSYKYEKKGKIHIFRIFDSLSFLSRNLAFLKLYIRILSIRPDIVHLEYSTIPNGRYGGLLGEPLILLLLLLRLISIPVYVTQHSVWLPEQVRERIYEKTKNKSLSSLSVIYLKIFTRFFGMMPNKLFLLVNLRNSKVTTKFAEEYRIPLHKIMEELHGVWVDIDKRPITRQSKRVVCLGVINPSKGYEYMIEAMAFVIKKFPDSSLLIAGSPPPTNYEEGKKYIGKLRRVVNENGLSHWVTIEDRYLTDNEFVEYIKTAAIVVLPYSKVVGASGIMHLAMRYQIPVIVGGSGLLFEELSEFIPVIPPMNAIALADKIIHILGDKDYYLKIMDNYSRYLADHDWRVVTKDIFTAYKNGTRG
jgi:glycosyltransferase involved in cell wall biosynthesis